MSLKKILENLTFTSSTFDQKYVHTCLASPGPFTVIFHGFFERPVCVEVLSCSCGMSAIQIEELNEIKNVWKPSCSDNRLLQLNQSYSPIFKSNRNVSRGGFNYILLLILKDPIE